MHEVHIHVRFRDVAERRLRGARQAARGGERASCAGCPGEREPVRKSGDDARGSERSGHVP